MATVRISAGSSGVSPDGGPPEGLWYGAKRRLLGPPLVNEQLNEERLSKPLALGVLSCDGISSAAYGTEMMLLELLPFFGLAAFTLVLPLTLVILVGIFLVMLSYREVVSVYTKAGGSYVVARENFGPRVAQVAAVALLIDYVVTLAVQTAAGSAAIVSAFPSLTTIPVIGPRILLVISVAAILLMCFGNLRGLREAGKAFALPTYMFSGSVILMIVTGLYPIPRARPPAGVQPMGGLLSAGTATVEGRVRTVQVRPVDRSSVLSCQVADATGELTVLFYGRRHIAGVEPGRRIRLRGTVGLRDDGGLAMINPAYDLMAAEP